MSCDLTDAVRQLVDYHLRSPALIVQTPEGAYLVSPDGSGEGVRNRYVISRSQLGTLMWENGFRSSALVEPQTAARVAALVAEFRPPNRRSDELSRTIPPRSGVPRKAGSS